MTITETFLLILLIVQVIQIIIQNFYIYKMIVGRLPKVERNIEDDSITVDGKKFEKFQVKSLKATADLIKKNGGKTFTSLDELIKELNNEK